MTTNTLFALEVHSRLTDDKPSLSRTLTDGKFYAKATELGLHHRSAPGVLGEKALVLARRSSRLAASEEQ